MSDSTQELTDATFQQAIAQGVSLIDFWAPWCPPCRSQGPIIDKVGSRMAGKALVAKVNVDENNGIAINLSIMNIPTIILFKDGKEMKRFVGLQSENELIASMELIMNATL